uniref:Uncharacterized protein n=1 Tax=viral metagenome TaxID=1070528 RepID=A0A6C0JZR6_9ZZZZ
MVSVYKVLLWVFLNILVVVTVMLAMFLQTTFKGADATAYNKLLASEFWATMEWLFVVPMQRIGYTFLNPAQMALSSYVFQFLGQLFSNQFWLNVATTIDDYVGMILILFGMVVSKFALLG